MINFNEAAEGTSNSLALVALSPRNSYYTRKNIGFAINEAVKKFGRVVVMVADGPDIANMLALGYPTIETARAKAQHYGSNLKNRARQICAERNYTDSQVKIIDWARDVDPHPAYTQSYIKFCNLLETNPAFKNDVESVARFVIESARDRGQVYDGKKDNIDVAEGVKMAIHYTLAEMAFNDAAAQMFGVSKTVFVYHRTFPLIENYINGAYDGVPKTHLGFQIINSACPDIAVPKPPQQSFG